MSRTFSGCPDIILVSPTPSRPSTPHPLFVLHRLVSVSSAAQERTWSTHRSMSGFAEGLSLISHSPSSEQYSAGFNVGINATQVNNLVSCLENTLRPVVYLSSAYPALIFGA